MLKKIQKHSHARFEQLGYPSKKLENWKFSSSKHLKKYDSINSGKDISIDRYGDEYTLCFVNGEMALESLNKFIYKDDMNILDIHELNDETTCSTSSNFEKEALFHLGLSTIKSGKYFEFKQGSKFDTPIQILNFYSKEAEGLRISSFNIFKLNQR